MTASCLLPLFTITQATNSVRHLFGVEGSLQALNGERDLNFLVTTASEKYVFKIANENETFELLDCQHQVLQRLADDEVLQQPTLSVESVNGKVVETITSEDGISHHCRLLPYVEGRLLSEVNPHTPELLGDLGETLAQMGKSLQGFTHEALDRPLLWKMHEALDTLERFKPLLASDEKRALVEHFESHFRHTVLALSDELRWGVIHNDANDNNVLVCGYLPWQQRVSSIIDFGDMAFSWLAAEPAVAAAYAMLGKQHTLDAAVAIVKGYHGQLVLNENEIRVLFDLICMRLCISVCNCAYQRSLEPDNDYLSISELPAWALLEKLKNIPHDFAHFVFRDACGLEPVPNNPRIRQWLETQQHTFASVVDLDLHKDPLLLLDLGVASPYFTHPDEVPDIEKLSKRITREIEDADCLAGIGAYAEYRLIYDDAADFVDRDGHRRNLHLGVDIFLPAESAVYAPLAGTVFSIANHAQTFDYGGTLILQHQIPQADDVALLFYTLYGHLDVNTIAHIKPGDTVKAGDQIASLGTPEQNGGWLPHLHFEIITDLLDESDNFAGAGSDACRNVWLSLCPDPNLILGMPESQLQSADVDDNELYQLRQKGINPALSLSYREPIHLVRGSLQYLYDAKGQRYIDAVNNVPHVGHCHQKVVAAEQAQAALLNTNSRYLYAAMTRYSERLLAKFPPALSVCYFTNSGSEANDLALRLARHYTQRQDVVILDHAYHGNLSTLIDISPYKHDGKGGQGRPAHVHKACAPDTYRGEFKESDPQAGEKYAQSVGQALRQAQAHGGAAAFMCETLLGCGGQLVLPPDYLSAAYAQARAAGALCIADEVQVGFGRLGSHFWGFETQEVVPDIVTLGKPMGNGHPLAGVITTREIADSFNNGMEYFNTFGGNPVSCAIGLAVLEVIEDENLQSNAQEVGDFLIQGLQALKERFAVIGDVRGLGLFIGVELVKDHNTLAPAAAEADYIMERMKQGGVVISTDGPFHNVLKIKPPICFNQANAQSLLDLLESVLMEDFMRLGQA
jgi:4-aminobutyrate aminotransferase-like enzyme/Ser/Thr protein kinase RdoA (MazF antagonist)